MSHGETWHAEVLRRAQDEQARVRFDQNRTHVDMARYVSRLSRFRFRAETSETVSGHNLPPRLGVVLGAVADLVSGVGDVPEAPLVVGHAVVDAEPQ